MSDRDQMYREDYRTGFLWSALWTFVLSWGVGPFAVAGILWNLKGKEAGDQMMQGWLDVGYTPAIIFGHCIGFGVISLITAAIVAPRYARHKSFGPALLVIVVGVLASGLIWMLTFGRF